MKLVKLPRHDSSTVSRLDSLRTYSQGEIYELIESTIPEIPAQMTA